MMGLLLTISALRSIALRVSGSAAQWKQAYIGGGQVVADECQVDSVLGKR